MIVTYPLWQWPQQRPDLTFYLKHITKQNIWNEFLNIGNTELLFLKK